MIFSSVSPLNAKISLGGTQGRSWVSQIFWIVWLEKYFQNCFSSSFSV